MKPMTTTDLMVEWCRRNKKYAMFISIPEPPWYKEFEGQKGYSEFYKHLFRAAPYLKTYEDAPDTIGGILSDGVGILTFDTEEEMDLYYRRTVGDDGALDKRCNSYDGPVRVYALTCGPEGMRNENT